MILSPQREQKQCHQKSFLASKYPRNAFASGAPPRTQLEELRRPLAELGEKGKGKGEEGRAVESRGGYWEVGEGKGEELSLIHI